MAVYTMTDEERHAWCRQIQQQQGGTPMAKPIYGANHAGCWFDCCRGIYIGEAIIEEAVSHGFVIDDPENLLGPCRRYADVDCYHEWTDEAEEYMQQFADDKHFFGYNEHTSDWGLWPIEEEA